MNAQTNRHSLRRRLLPIGIIVSLLAVALGMAAPAQADHKYEGNWRAAMWTFTSKQSNAKGLKIVIRDHTGPGYWTPYSAEFDPYGEKLTVRDNWGDGHAAKVIMGVYKNGKLIDPDTFYVATADTPKTFNVGTPDGSGNIREGLTVSLKLCVNNTFCSSTMWGTA